VFYLVSCITQNEIVVLAGDMNGHVGSSDVGYDGTHGGFGYGDRNADGSRILEFAVHQCKSSHDDCLRVNSTCHFATVE